MKIQYASDLHLDFPLNHQYVLSGGLKPEGEILVLAGDIVNLFELSRYDYFWDWCQENFKQTVVVPGNHDYYGNWPSLEDMAKPMKKAIRPNVHYCNNVVLHLSGIDFICSTLWSDIKMEYAIAIVGGLRDFRAIHFADSEDSEFTRADYLWLHNQAFDFIQNAVESSKASKTVVLSHHLPSYSVINDSFRGSPFNSAYATELGDWIADHSVNYWIYGHSHNPVETTIGKTRLLSNPLGYISYGEGEWFVPNKTFEFDE